MFFQTFHILFLFWAIHIIRRIFYSIYFWQLKEYRADRIIGDAKKSIKVLFPKTSWVVIFIAWENLIATIFYILGLYSLFLLFKKSWKFPKFTKKAIFLLFLSFAFLIYCSLIFLNKFFIFVIATEIFLGSFTFLLVAILQIPTFFIKRIIYKKAKNKIRQFKNLTVIGITGSYGKSSTKEFLYTVLSKKYKVLKTSGNINTEIGVAKTIINKLESKHEIFIVEMGAYRKGEIALLCDIAKPNIGIVTGVNEQHLSLFGSLENLLSAEGGRELAQALGNNGLLVVNGNNKYCLDLCKRFSGRKLIYNKDNEKVDSDILADSITIEKEKISFIAINKNGEMAHFEIGVLGGQNVQNMLAAILVARELGMSFEEISSVCKNIKQEQSGITLTRNKYGIYIIDSSYSSNPDGVMADLDYLSIFSGKKVIVMPCLIELGEESGRIHEKIGQKISQVCNLAIITSKDKFKEIKGGLKDNQTQLVFCDKPEDIYSMITLSCKSGDAILLEGRVPAGLINLLKV